ncbi:ATP-dependent DNA helicase Q-like 4B [Linum grandiflorum]
MRINRDATLHAISDRIPRTKPELQQINGIGRETIAKYGDRLMLTIESAISNYYAEEGCSNQHNTSPCSLMVRTASKNLIHNFQRWA